MVNCAQVYSIITIVKLAAIIGFLLYLGVQRKDEIELWYKTGLRADVPSIANCQSCYDQASRDPNRLYEFGYCSSLPQFETLSAQNNLFLNKNWFAITAYKSNVHHYLADVILIAVIVIIMSLVFPIVSFEVLGQKWDKSRPDPNTGESDDDVNDVCIAYNYQIGIVTGALIIAGGLELSELYFFGSNCYVSPYTTTYLAASTGLIRILIALLAIESLFMCCWPNKYALLCFNIIAGLAVIAYVLLAVVMIGRNLSTADAKDWRATIIIAVGVSHIIETPIILFACLPRKKSVDYLNL